MGTKISELEFRCLDLFVIAYGVNIINVELKKTKLRGLRPQANYTD
jgi:hypothetical protein